MYNSIDEYVLDHSTELPDALEWLERETSLKTNHAKMLAGPHLGRFLINFSRMLSPERIMEIGTFTGYSAICLAMGLKEGGHLDAFEKNDFLEPLIQEGFKRAGVANKITIHYGDALETIPGFKDNLYDLIYIDGNKREYCKYYELVFDLLRPGGYILADNVLWYEKVIAEPLPKDAQTQEILKFNRMVKNDNRVENFILPLRDGLNIIRKL